MKVPSQSVCCVVDCLEQKMCHGPHIDGHVFDTPGLHSIPLTTTLPSLHNQFGSLLVSKSLLKPPETS
ncbi:hypothetical protein Pcinc_013132 [Petrolisthes cinctipes]|uniref:Uncharacterized protein n=1 Tax=Petrolisthes cinctipes TaxID=88211 RepID=A0AAE1KUL7_PETCI|nr:hypothetical protein Pcinc_013132 [Petrolisthes cinctipes]